MKKLQEKRDEILKSAAKHGAFNVRVFSSVARGDNIENSDVNFWVDYDLTKTSPWFPGGLLMDLQELLNCQVDVVTEKRLSPLI